MDLPSVSLAYFPVAVGLGALHALEPGHAKTMTAAYLVGIHGRWPDAVLLGLAAAVTHSAVVIAIAVGAVLLGRQAFTGDAIRWLQIGSGTVVVALGSWMLWRRLHPPAHHHHHDAPPVMAGDGEHRCAITIAGAFPAERMHLRFARPPTGPVTVVLHRPDGDERLTFTADPAEPVHLVSDQTPQEPHEFQADLIHASGSSLPFAMHEPDDHVHDHLDDDAHARAHAARMPGYVGTGQRPSRWQVVSFGAAGGLVPCPASISVMLLALSVGSAFSGLVLVAGFSIGLALALVGVGLLVVAGMSRLGDGGRFARVSRHVPAISAGVVVLSGIAAIALAFIGHE